MNKTFFNRRISSLRKNASRIAVSASCTAVFALILAFLTLLFLLKATAAPGDLDPTFGTGGKVITLIGSGDDSAYSVAVQSDGKIVVAGYSNNGTNKDFALVRYNSNGTLDASFGSGGMVTTPIGNGNDYGISVVLQSDGRILVAGYSANASNYDFALVRYNSNGTLDTNFGNAGSVTTDFGSRSDFGDSVVLQNDGKIVVAGYSFDGYHDILAIARYNTNGTLDQSFGTGGKLTNAVGSVGGVGNSVTVQSDGKIVVAGSAINTSKADFALVRFNTSGTLDQTFGNGVRRPLPLIALFPTQATVW